LVDVRHGSGTYVTADAVSMLALSLGAVIQLENVGAREVLSVLGILNEQSAAAAAVEGTAEEKAQVRAAMDVLDNVKDDRIAAGQAVRSFHAAIARASHNNLLSVLCGFLTDLQTELAADLAGESFEVWRGIFKELRAPRLRVVEAIEAGERDEALVAMRDFQNMSIRLITALPKAKEVHLNDPKLDAVLSAMMGRLKART
jgi:GntR family transcriptional repressor for pyruvate dehydrogenase complex